MEDLHKKNMDLILLNYCQGNNDGVSRLIEKWIPTLYLYSFKYLRNKEKAEDVVGDCIEKLFLLSLSKRKMLFLINEVNFKSFVFVMVKNKSLDVLKIEKNRNRIIDDIKGLWSSVTRNLSLDYFSQDDVDNYFSILSQKEQQVFKYYVDGYTITEIAKELNISSKTVGNTVSLAKNKLKTIKIIIDE